MNAESTSSRAPWNDLATVIGSLGCIVVIPLRDVPPPQKFFEPDYA